MWAMTRLLVGVALLVALVAALAGAARAEPSETYVVVLKPGVADVRGAAAGLSRAHGGTTGYVYEHALRGFSIRVPAAGAAGIAHSPLVEYVEADREFTVSAQNMPTGIARIAAPGNANLDIDGVDDERVDVDVAVIDTGIDLDHPDLNVVGGTNCVTFFSSCGSGGDDGNGHGTHVAGTIGALDNEIGVVGVAPGARLWAVRVLNNNGTGTTSQIIAGMDWVTARASTIEVANMSISGGGSTSLDSAVNRMADAGVAVAVAAGNNDADASGYSPARAAKVLTVSAIADYDGLPGGLGQPPSNFCLDQDDTLADFSNWGPTIEIAAPGCRILSTYLNGGYAWINGTSMASPHVAGALGLLASKGFQRDYSGVSSLYETLKAEGKLDWTDESGDGVKEPLLDVSDAAVFDPKTVAGPGGGGPPPNQPPTASFTYSCTNLSCSFDASGSSDSDGSIACYSWNFGDSATGTGATVSHAYPNGGTYTVTLTVQDDKGASGSTSSSITVTPAPNQPPTASFTYSCTNLSCSFDASGSSDSDGTIASYSWNFGDSATGTGATISHAYPNGGTYTVTLTVQDDKGAIGSTSSSITVTPAPAVISVALAGSSTSSGSQWTANVRITLTRNGSPVQAVSVTGTWSNGATGTASCVTGSNGQCTISKSGIKKSTGSVLFTVNTVAGSSTFTGTSSIAIAKP